MSGHSRSRRGSVWSLRAVLTLIIAGAAGLLFSPVSHAAAAAAACRTATGPFHVQGSRVLQADGRPYVPYGVTVSTLDEYPGTEPGARPGESTLQQTEAQIQAIRDSWCGNTVRLQVEQDTLVGVDGHTFNQRYMGVIEAAVHYAVRRGLVVVINDQTGFDGPATPTRNEPLPTRVTEVFWHVMDKVYRHDPQVVYDLFNEPRPYTPGTSEAAWWARWRTGGSYTYTYAGKPIAIQAIGEQALADYVRSDKSTNLLWVEGLQFQALDYLVRHPATYLIRGDGPIVYTYHHTAIGKPHDPATWNKQFGGLARSVPVVDGEWTNYAESGPRYPNGDTLPECWHDAPETVPPYLAYLHRLGIGMTTWGLRQGVMNSTLGNYAAPSTFGPNWSCTSGLDQGAGRLVQDWYLQSNGGRTPSGHASRTYRLTLSPSGTHTQRARLKVVVAWTNRSVDVSGTLVNRSSVPVRPGITILPSTATTRAVGSDVRKQTSADGHMVAINTGWVQVNRPGGVRSVVLEIASVKDPRDRVAVTATRPPKS